MRVWSAAIRPDAVVWLMWFVLCSVVRSGRGVQPASVADALRLGGFALVPTWLSGWIPASASARSRAIPLLPREPLTGPRYAIAVRS